MSVDPNKPDDRELEEFLNSEGDISRAWRRGPKPQTPAELDRAVLQIAREAAAAPPAPRRMPRWPLALAATIVLSFSIFVAIYKDDGTRREVMLDSAAPVIDLKEQAAPAAPAENEAKAQARPAAAPEPFPAREELQKKNMAQRKQEQPKLKDAPAAAAPTGASAGAAFAPAPTELGAARQDAQAEAKPAAPPPPAAQALGRMQEYRNSATAAKMEHDEMRAKSAEDVRQLAPEAWIQRIRATRDRGDLAAAKLELKEFQKSFPQHPLPEDLKRLIEP